MKENLFFFFLSFSLIFDLFSTVNKYRMNIHEHKYTSILPRGADTAPGVRACLRHGLSEFDSHQRSFFFLSC